MKISEKFKIWLRKNWGTAILFGFFSLLLINADAKAWFMRQILSTGILNSTIEKKNTEKNQAAAKTQDAENFSVANEKGEIIQISDLKGKVVFINFWASWCPPCRAEFPSIQKFYDKYKMNENLVFLTINLDDDKKLGKNYLQKEKYTIPFLVQNGSIPQSIFNGSLPTTVVLDKSGNMRMHHTGMADYSKKSFFEEINQLIAEK